MNEKELKSLGELITLSNLNRNKSIKTFIGISAKKIEIRGFIYKTPTDYEKSDFFYSFNFDDNLNKNLITAIKEIKNLVKQLNI
jgi:transcription initiation factor TFIIIB Brf1 subunit/transcription initiation factor TFIIB